MSRRILLINGPNLNLLGKREPHIYGSTTLEDIETQARQQAHELGVEIDTFQSNHEGAIVDRIQETAGWGPNVRETETPGKRVSAIIINAGALTHTSVAVRDALAAVAIPFVELHVSNVHARETFRAHSYLSDKAVAVICGMGAYGYSAAIKFAAKHLKIEGE